MRRRKTKLFAGAAGRVKDKAKLDGWIVQRKFDGQYVELDTDCKGKICELRSKTNRVLNTDESVAMLGVLAGYPNSTLIGELMGHTEAGKKDTRTQGYARVHLFDALTLGDVLVNDDPYFERLDALRKMHADIQAIVHGKKEFWEDDNMRARDFHGKFTERVPMSWKRTPIVESFYTSEQAKGLWASYVSKGGEGLVWCDPNAWVGKRGCKLKEKPMSTIDAEVTSMGERYCEVMYLDIAQLPEGVAIHECPVKTLIVSCVSRNLHVGDVVEIGYERLTQTSQALKHPRILRKRDDLL